MKTKIGVYDSGVGGLTVLKSLIEKGAGSEFVYLGDTARAPYGVKCVETIRRYAEECSLFFKLKKVDCLAIACNTVSSAAVDVVKGTVCKPVIGTIKPAVKEITSNLAIKRVGVIATPATIKSRVYERAIKKIRPDIEVVSKPTPLFVPLVEEGIKDSKVINSVCDYYLKEFVEKKIEVLVLGCTHFPLLRAAIKEFFKDKINLLDSAEPLAKEAVKALQVPKASSFGNAKVFCYLTDRTPVFQDLAAAILPPNVSIRVEKFEMEEFLNYYSIAG